MNGICKWYYRQGTGNSHWALRDCGDAVYLSKIPCSKKSSVGIANFYDGRICPKCHRKIKMFYDGGV